MLYAVLTSLSLQTERVSGGRGRFWKTEMDRTVRSHWRPVLSIEYPVWHKKAAPFKSDMFYVSLNAVFSEKPHAP